MTDVGFANGHNDAKRGIDFIGVGCAFICHDGRGRFLLHKRSQHCRDEQGNWDNGGGSHEFGHNLEDTVAREVKEEYGADVIKMQFIQAYDVHRRLVDGTPTHWVQHLYAVQVDPKQAKNNEPYKINEIGWFTLDNLPSPLHSQIHKALDPAHTLNII